MKKLTKIEYSAYLPYDVDLIVDDVYEGFKCKLVTSNYTNSLTNGLTIDEAICHTAKLLLHPLFDLTKPITYKGETFVPIIELFKIATDEKYIIDNASFDSVKNCYCIIFNDISMVFMYNEEMGFSQSINGKALHVGHQLLLFQKLYEWHFAVNIPEELYVDINTLK